MAQRLAPACCLLLLTACAGSRRTAGRTPAPEPGSVAFQSYCAACHRYDDQGMGAGPPLAGALWVTGPEERLIKIVLHGVRGPMVVLGKTYDLEMPGFGQILSDADVATLLTYVRKRFGAASEVTPEAVRRVRAAHQARTEYWRAEELLTSEH